jgi:hypothetical protein
VYLYDNDVVMVYGNWLWESSVFRGIGFLNLKSKFVAVRNISSVFGLIAISNGRVELDECAVCSVIEHKHTYNLDTPYCF